MNNRAILPNLEIIHNKLPNKYNNKGIINNQRSYHNGLLCNIRYAENILQNDSYTRN